MSIKQINEKLEKSVVKDFIKLAKEYYGEDFNTSLKRNGDKVVWNEQPRGYFTITLNICGDEQLLLSTPVIDVNQDFITETVKIINSAIQNEEIKRLKEHYSIT